MAGSIVNPLTTLSRGTERISQGDFDLRLPNTRDAGGVGVSFEDTGRGMSDDIARQVFTPFFTTKEGGNGIGLATARRIIEMHGGSLDFTTSQGRGTCFVIRVPVAAGEPPGRREP